jgi:hypothetical protein
VHSRHTIPSTPLNFIFNCSQCWFSTVPWSCLIFK